MNPDLQLFFLLNNLAGHSPELDSLIIFFAQYFAYVLIIIFALMVWRWRASGEKKFKLLLATILSSCLARFLITELIRLFYHRPRPFVTYSVHQLLSSPEWSFPSGHATFFFALSISIFLSNRRWGSFFILAAIVMTACRIIAGVHYPSDILAGAVIGGTTAYGVHLILKKISRKTQPHFAGNNFDGGKA